MLSRIFPTTFDNAYRGHWLAIWILAVVALLKAIQGGKSMITPVSTMVTADGIPLSTFNAAAQHETIVMFALLGMYLTVVPLIGLVALVRYRAMIPFAYLMLIAVQLGAGAINMIYEPSTGHPVGFWVNLGILAVTLLGFVLSLVPARGAAP